MYSNNQIQKQLLHIDPSTENPAFGLRPKSMPLQQGYADTQPYAHEQVVYVPLQHGNGILKKALAFLVGAGLLVGGLYGYQQSGITVKPYSPQVQVTAQPMPFNPSIQQIQPQPIVRATALPVPVQQQAVKQVQPQEQSQAPVVPTAEVVEKVAPQIKVVPDGTDRRFVPTALPTAIPPTIIPVPEHSVAVNANDEQCVTVPSANNTVCDASGLRMDKATQEWVASMMAAGLIHPPTEEAQK